MEGLSTSGGVIEGDPAPALGTCGSYLLQYWRQKIHPMCLHVSLPAGTHRKVGSIRGWPQSITSHTATTTHVWSLYSTRPLHYSGTYPYYSRSWILCRVQRSRWEHWRRELCQGRRWLEATSRPQSSIKQQCHLIGRTTTGSSLLHGCRGSPESSYWGQTYLVQFGTTDGITNTPPIDDDWSSFLRADRRISTCSTRDHG